MSGPPDIRPYEDRDRDAVISLVLPIQREEFGVEITAEEQPDLVDIPKFVRRGAGEFWVALEGERIVGTAALLEVIPPSPVGRVAGAGGSDARRGERRDAGVYRQRSRNEADDPPPPAILRAGGGRGPSASLLVAHDALRHRVAPRASHPGREHPLRDLSGAGEGLPPGAGFGALRKMFVAADRRGAENGIARRLLETALAHAKARGLAAVYLGTTAAYHRAHRFYEKNGFTRVEPDALPREFPRIRQDSRFYRIATADFPPRSG